MEKVSWREAFQAALFRKLSSKSRFTLRPVPTSSRLYPSGDCFVYASGNEIWRLNPDGSTRPTYTSSDVPKPWLGPDGNWYVRGTPTEDIMMKTGQPVPRRKDGSQVWIPAWPGLPWKAYRKKVVSQEGKEVDLSYFCRESVKFICNGRCYGVSVLRTHVGVGRWFFYYYEPMDCPVGIDCITYENIIFPTLTGFVVKEGLYRNGRLVLVVTNTSSSETFIATWIGD